MPEGEEQVNLSWDLWCDKHLSPLKQDWPTGAAQAMIGLFNACVESNAFFNLTSGKVENFNRVLKEISPACCFLGDEIMEQVIAEAKKGKCYGAGTKEKN